MRHVTDQERRHRIGVRHALAGSAKVATPEQATAAMTVLHATEPASVHLACRARCIDLGIEDVDRALYETRTLVKQLSMRRTLFVYERELLPAAWGSAAARVAAEQRRTLAVLAEQAGVTPSGGGSAWVEVAEAAALRCLQQDGLLTSRELRERLPELAGQLEFGSGTTWAGAMQLTPRVLTLLHSEARIARATNAGHWRVSRPRWAAIDDWLGEMPVRLPKREGYAELIRRWLWTFGPGTVDDIAWWLGSTKGDVRTALGDVGAVEVTLDGGASGWLRPDDLDVVAAPEPWLALLPTLDSTVMGWKARGFYLGSYASALFDRSGNAGTTVWLNGEVVGAWVQDPHQVVQVRLLVPVPRSVRRRLDEEAARLTDWLGGQRVFALYSSPLMLG